MGQRPIAIRIKVAKPDTASGEYVVLSVSEAARNLNVSERTVYRMLKSGDLERDSDDMADTNGSRESDIKMSNRLKSSREKNSTVLFMSDKNVTDVEGEGSNLVGELRRQIAEKDAQIAHLLTAQQDLTRTVQRIQEQMYELAHLVLTHNVAAAQAKAEAELKVQEAQARSKGGLAGLLRSRNRKT